MNVDEAIKRVIAEYDLSDWLTDYPWLTGYLGDASKPVWFIGENPSLRSVRSVHRKAVDESPNLQWSYDRKECRLFRDALTKAGLKSGLPNIDDGWNCYITNAVKEPEMVKERNREKKFYWKEQAERWLEVLQIQIDEGNPKILVAIGGDSEKILKYMKRIGLMAPGITRVHHYTYVMRRPEGNLGPGHPDRQREFIRSIKEIADGYSGS